MARINELVRHHPTPVRQAPVLTQPSATTAIQSRSKRTRNQDEEGDPQEATTHSAPRKSDANDEEIIEESNEQDGADSFSSRAIS